MPKIKRGRCSLRWVLSAAVVGFGLVSPCLAQENAGMVIPTSLLPCYANASLHTRNNLPVFGMSQLIEVIRKVEDWPLTSLSMKTLSLQLVQRFRMDGIRKDPNTKYSPGVVPYTPSGPEFFRHRILLRDLLPGNAYTFPNVSLTDKELCLMHFMTSSSMNDIYRGDEDTTCAYVQNYETEVVSTSSKSSYGTGSSNQGRSGSRFNNNNYNRGRTGRRGPRKAREAMPGIDSDVEIIDPSTLTGDESDDDDKRASMANYAHSACPIQNGVVWTKWGGVSAGSVIAGIASGLMPETMTVSALTDQRPRPRYYQSIRRNPVNADYTGTIDNKWAATFSGDLAVVAMLQGPVDNSTMDVGMTGGWNSTLAPRYYFMSKDDDGAMTDPEVRGDLDGLILGTNIYEWNSEFSGYLKLSQVLDMYYSERGVFSRDYRACARTGLMDDVAASSTLTAQAESFSEIYEQCNTLTVNIASATIQGLADLAASDLTTYVSSNLTDPSCVLGSSDLMTRTMVDLIVVLDTSWTYSSIHPALGYLLYKIDANQYGSNMTVLDAKDGSVLFNSSYPILDWFETYNLSVQVNSSQGINVMVGLGSAMQVLRMLDSTAYRNQKIATRGKAVLFVEPSTLGTYDSSALSQRLTNFKALYPDVSILALTQGSRSTFAPILNDTNLDAYIFSSVDPGATMRSLANRLSYIPRRLRNTNCDADWVQQRTNGATYFTGYVEPLGINYYRMTPNNFFRSTSASVMVTASSSSSSLTVCYSRTVLRPNSTNNATTTSTSSSVTCQTLSSSSSVTISLGSPCSGVDYIKNCNPLYLSVASTSTTAATSATCTADDCRFPDMILFTVTVSGLGCWSGASSIGLSNALAAFALLLLSMRLLL